MAEGQVRTLLYGSEKFTVAEADWRQMADEYETKARGGGGWLDVPTVGAGVATIWAGPSIPVLVSRPRTKGEGRGRVIS